VRFETDRSICGIDKELAMRINPPLVALAIGAFGIGVTEFAPMGMLPSIATDLGVSIPLQAAGQCLCHWRADRRAADDPGHGEDPARYLLIGLMAIFIT
jgi:DHA1 family inner membrane transport protein